MEIKKLNTQENCKNQFLVILEDQIKDIELIDKATPYTYSEPEWWLDMMEIQKLMYKFKKKYK